VKAIRERLARSEEGFTLIEVLVATIILVLGSLAIFMTFAAAIHNVQRGRDTQIAQSVAQREIEKIHSLPYERIAMTALPAASAEAASPAKRVSGTEFAMNRAGTEKAPLSVAGAGVCSTSKPCVNSAPSSTCVGTASTTFSNGTATGSVYCYVTTGKDEACETATGKSCPFKRIVVAVWLEKAANQTARPAYYELQSNVNP
jgi:prepilin-type N-terminal cleavage/methylation domain-containing protein